MKAKLQNINIKQDLFDFVFSKSNMYMPVVKIVFGMQVATTPVKNFGKVSYFFLSLPIIQC